MSGQAPLPADELDNDQWRSLIILSDDVEVVPILKVKSMATASFSRRL